MTSHTAPAGAAPSSVPRTTATGRLGQGELRRLTAEYLVQHPATEFTPGEISRALNRSSGAVTNALERLSKNGQAEKRATTPRRYIANSATADAARSSKTAPRSSPSASRPSSGSPVPGRDAQAAASRSSSDGGTKKGAAATGTVNGPVTRPNGQAYHPRVLADQPDVAVLRRLREAGIPALLYGPPGTGKTSLVEAAFDDLITIAGDGDTAVADFVGEYTLAPGGGYEFVYGPLVTAMAEGRALLIDDATLISPKVLAVVYPAMDGRRRITVKAHKGETIEAKDGFYVIAGHNPGVHGAVLTEALASRFAFQVQVSTDYDLARSLKISPRAVRVARNLSTQVAQGEIGWAPQLRELIAFQKIADVLGIDAAVANLIGIAPEDDRDVVAKVVSRVYGESIKPLALGRQI